MGGKMRLRLHSYAVLLSMVVPTLALAEFLSPLDYSAYSPIQARDVDCPSNFFSCEDEGSEFAGTCCAKGTECSLDGNNQVACCPSGAVCTGAAYSTGGATATTAPSFVSNSYFAFPYIPTTFPDSAACTVALDQCSDNYRACTSGLLGGGSGYGVTVVVPGGGGTTVEPTHATVPTASATSICSSLSSQACHDFQTAQCTDGSIAGSGNAAPRQTAAACMAGVIAGLGLGIIGGQM